MKRELLATAALLALAWPVAAQTPEPVSPIAALYDARFCRMWEFYLCLSEVAFRHRGCMVFQIQLSKRVDAVPLTRDYISGAAA